MSHNKNKVTRLVEEGKAQSAMDVVVQGSYADQVLAVGYPMGAFRQPTDDSETRFPAHGG
jgi:hypothetical protein